MGGENVRQYEFGEFNIIMASVPVYKALVLNIAHCQEGIRQGGVYDIFWSLVVLGLVI